MKTKANAFTLFEIMLVMVLSISITAIGMVSLSRLQKVFGLRSAADEIKSQLQYGRELAVANRNGAVYSVSLSGTIFVLKSNGIEISRYQLPPRIVVTPPSLNWTFTPNTGAVTTCSPCSFTLSTGDLAEIISMQSNGIVN